MDRRDFIIAVLVIYILLSEALFATSSENAAMKNKELLKDNNALAIQVADLSRLCFLDLSHPVSRAAARM